MHPHSPKENRRCAGGALEPWDHILDYQKELHPSLVQPVDFTSFACQWQMAHTQPRSLQASATR